MGFHYNLAPQPRSSNKPKNTSVLPWKLSWQISYEHSNNGASRACKWSRCRLYVTNTRVCLWARIDSGLMGHFACRVAHVGGSPQCVQGVARSSTTLLCRRTTYHQWPRQNPRLGPQLEGWGWCSLGTYHCCTSHWGCSACYTQCAVCSKHCRCSGHPESADKDCSDKKYISTFRFPTKSLKYNSFKTTTKSTSSMWKGWSLH